MLRANLDKVPALDPRDIDDLYWGCASRPDARAPTWLGSWPWPGGYDQLPGATINRFCASSVQIDADGVPRDQGRRGRRVPSAVSSASRSTSATGAGGADDEARNPLFGDPMARTVETAKTNATWTGLKRERAFPARRLHRHGLTAENVATSLGISRERQDEWGVTSQNRAEKAIANGFFEREITPVTMPDGRVVDRRRATAGRHHRGRQRPQPGLSRENGTVTAGNCCPLNDGAAAVVVMSDTKAAETHPAGPGRRHRRLACPPRSAGLGPIEA